MPWLVIRRMMRLADTMMPALLSSRWMRLYPQRLLLLPNASRTRDRRFAFLSGRRMAFNW